MPKRSIKFLSDISRNKMINGVKEKLSSSPDKDLYTAALDFVTPRSHLLHVLAYDENQKISLKSQ